MTHAFAPDADFKGMMENQLPSFWTPAFSKLFAVGQGTPVTRTAHSPSPAEKAVMARERRVKGWSLGQIAKDLGVSKATVVNYLRDYPYR